MFNEGGSPRDKRAPRVRERRRKKRERKRDKFERFDERDLVRVTETTSAVEGTGGWKQDPGQ